MVSFLIGIPQGPLRDPRDSRGAFFGKFFSLGSYREPSGISRGSVFDKLFFHGIPRELSGPPGHFRKRRLLVAFGVGQAVSCYLFSLRGTLIN